MDADDDIAMVAYDPAELTEGAFDATMDANFTWDEGLTEIDSFFDVELDEGTPVARKGADMGKGQGDDASADGGEAGYHDAQTDAADLGRVRPPTAHDAATKQLITEERAATASPSVASTAAAGQAMEGYHVTTLPQANDATLAGLPDQLHFTEQASAATSGSATEFTGDTKQANPNRPRTNSMDIGIIVHKDEEETKENVPVNEDALVPLVTSRDSVPGIVSDKAAVSPSPHLASTNLPLRPSPKNHQSTPAQSTPGAPKMTPEHLDFTAQAPSSEGKSSLMNEMRAEEEHSVPDRRRSNISVADDDEESALGDSSDVDATEDEDDFADAPSSPVNLRERLREAADKEEEDDEDSEAEDEGEGEDGGDEEGGNGDEDGDEDETGADEEDDERGEVVPVTGENGEDVGNAEAGIEEVEGQANGGGEAETGEEEGVTNNVQTDAKRDDVSREDAMNGDAAAMTGAPEADVADEEDREGERPDPEREAGIADLEQDEAGVAVNWRTEDEDVAMEDMKDEDEGARREVKPAVTTQTKKPIRTRPTTNATRPQTRSRRGKTNDAVAQSGDTATKESSEESAQGDADMKGGSPQVVVHSAAQMAMSDDELASNSPRTVPKTKKRKASIGNGGNLARGRRAAKKVKTTGGNVAEAETRLVSKRDTLAAVAREAEKDKTAVTEAGAEANSSMLKTTATEPSQPQTSVAKPKSARPTKAERNLAKRPKQPRKLHDSRAIGPKELKNIGLDAEEGGGGGGVGRMTRRQEKEERAKAPNAVAAVRGRRRGE